MEIRRWRLELGGFWSQSGLFWSCTPDLLLVTHGESSLSQSPHYCTHRLGRELRNFRSRICVSKSVPIPVDLPG